VKTTVRGKVFQRMLHWLRRAQNGAWSFGLLIAIALIVIGAGQNMGPGLAASPADLESGPLSEPPEPPMRVSPAGETTVPTHTPTITPSPSATPLEDEIDSSFGTLVYVSRSDGYEHIFAFSIVDQQTRLLAAGPWHDRDPVVSPDGSRIAFSSHRDGNWELYLLDIKDGSLRRLTNTPGFEGNPTWSPDGMWLAYEAYYESNFDIWIMAADASQAPIQLTSDPAADTSPDWDPVNRRIAFVSDRDGNPDIFIAFLDRADSRFLNLTIGSSQPEGDPAFRPDGISLAFVRQQDGMDFIIVKNLSTPELPGAMLGQGLEPVWISDGSAMLAILDAAQQSYLMIYPFDRQGSSVAGLPQPDRLSGLGWSQRDIIRELSLAGMELTSADQNGGNQVPEAITNGSVQIAPLQGVDVPTAKLSHSVIGAFTELRDRVILDAGWDFLGTLDNAFIGVNDPMPPGFAHVDWLYTGRAFAISSSALHARWVEIVREDFGGLTYWRVFVRAGMQDGSQGEPLRQLAWDLDARYGSDPSDYDGGGQLRLEVPAGYYVDFTELAADFGFERQPALPNWRTFYPGARFGEYVRMDGRTWHEAMLEIYPPSAFITPTPYRTPIPGG